jgi:hypothetical protein
MGVIMNKKELIKELKISKKCIQMFGGATLITGAVTGFAHNSLSQNGLIHVYPFSTIFSESVTGIIPIALGGLTVYFINEYNKTKNDLNNYTMKLSKNKKSIN